MQPRLTVENILNHIFNILLGMQKLHVQIHLTTRSTFCATVHQHGLKINQKLNGVDGEWNDNQVFETARLVGKFKKLKYLPNRI